MLYMLLPKTIILNFVETVFFSEFKIIISKKKGDFLIMLEILSISNVYTEAIPFLYLLSIFSCWGPGLLFWELFIHGVGY